MLTEHEKATEKDLKLSIERIIDLVRNVRNGLIQDFLQDANLRTYFLQQYNRELSQVKSEFLKRDLKELLDSPVDLSHYGLLIKQMQDSNTASISSTHHDLFYKELEKIFSRYNYWSLQCKKKASTLETFDFLRDHFFSLRSSTDT